MQISLSRFLKPANLLALLLLTAFAIFLVFAGRSASFNFDASYNLLSYQSLANGTGFNYTYSNKIVPFNPPISTGPELYAPVALIWKITGQTNYFVAVYVLIAYFIVFLAFATFYFFKKPHHRLIFIASFLAFFFLNKKIFDHQLHVDPLGEILATGLAFSGLYFLHQKKLLPAFILLGFALDVKTNIVVALAPVLAIFLFIHYLLPLIRQKKYRAVVLKAVRLFALSLVILVPFLVYTRLAPALVLNDWEKTIHSQAQKSWLAHQKSRGFGQIYAFTNNPSPAALGQFFQFTGGKIKDLSELYPGGYLTLFLVLISFPLLLWLARGHFSFYAFFFAGFIVLWWLFGTVDPWYRYLFIPELMYSLGLAALLPRLINAPNKKILLLTALLTAAIFLPQFSLISIKKSLDSEAQKDFRQMSETIRPLPIDQLFTYGWFQAPQLMLLTNKRFMDYQDQEARAHAREKYDQIYLVTTIENTLIPDAMAEVTGDLEPIQKYGYNKLYLIHP